MKSIESFGSERVLISTSSFVQHANIKKSLRTLVLNRLSGSSIVCIGGEAYCYGLASMIHHITHYTNNKSIYNDCALNASFYRNKTVNNFLIDYNTHEDFYNGDVLIINIAKLNSNIVTEINKRFYKRIIIISCHHDDFWKKTKHLKNYKITSRVRFHTKLFFVSVNVFVYRNEIPTFVSLGATCAVAYNLRRYGLRNEAFPFDWVRINNFSQLNEVFRSDFKNFTNLKVIKQSEHHPHFESGQPHSLQIKNAYHFQFYHEVLDTSGLEEFAQILAKRIERLKLLGNKKIVFVVLNDFENKFDDTVLHDYFINYEVRRVNIDDWDGDWTYGHFHWNKVLFK